MEKINEIIQRTYETHKATLIQNSERYCIIDWRRADGSGNCYVNYIVDKKRGSLIVSGDLGDSIATWYNPVEPCNLKKYIHNDVYYYMGKFQCASDKYVYDEDDIISGLKAPSYASQCLSHKEICSYPSCTAAYEGGNGMTIQGLSFINKKLSEADIPYSFGEWSGEIVYPYFVGEYTETEPLYEYGETEDTFMLTGTSRVSDAKLDLERYKKKIREIFSELQNALQTARQLPLCTVTAVISPQEQTT